MSRAALYICYDSVAEPLIESQVLAYLRELVPHGFDTSLVSFEKSRLTRTARAGIRLGLGRAGIRWDGLQYHAWPSLSATLYDIFRGGLRAARLCRRDGISLVHGRSHVGGAVALIAKRLCGAKMVFDMRGLLADEYVDAGRWASTGVKYRLTKAMERILFKHADAVVMLTRTIKEELVATEPALRHRAGDIEVIPCCVDADRFRRSPERRAIERRKRRWEGKRVLIYVGKLGTWYLAEEMARFFSIAREQDSRWFFQVLTQSDPALMGPALQRARVPPEAYAIGSAEPGGVPVVMGAADAGISFILPCYSKRASSPTKVAEYLAAGLPVVSTAGIGDCDGILGSPNLGVLVDMLDEPGYRRAARALTTLLDDPGTPVACHQFARRELSLEAVGVPRYTRVYTRLFAGAVQSQAVGEQR